MGSEINHLIFQVLVSGETFLQLVQSVTALSKEPCMHKPLKRLHVRVINV